MAAGGTRFSVEQASTNIFKMYALGLTFCILFWSTCFASVSPVSPKQQHDSKVIEQLNHHGYSLRGSPLCQAIALLYHLPHHRRFIMESADGIQVKFFLAESLFFLETNQPNKLRFQVLEQLLAENNEQTNDLSELFWNFLVRAKFAEPRTRKAAETIELVCFSWLEKVKQVVVESYQTLAATLNQQAEDSDYVVAFFHKTENIMNLE